MSEIIKLSSPATSEFWKVPVLFEDEHLLALSKPAGLLTSPDRYDAARPNLMKLLHRDIERGTSWAKQRGLTYLMNAHRLDFQTTGVILLAKDKPTLVSLATQFGSEKPVKIYVALIQGAPAQPTFECDVKIGPHALRPGYMRVDPKDGKRSRTEFSVRESFEDYTLLECRPLTGRTHQIRVHLKYLKLPIVADDLYGGHPLWLSKLKSDFRLKPGHEERPLIGTLALHAEQLIIRALTGEGTIKIEAPWPKDLTVGVKYLKRYGGHSSVTAGGPS